MERRLLGWPPDGPRLDLDHRQFSYAGKFVMTTTGKAVAVEGNEVVGAIAFNEDRTDPDALWLRYVTVREDYRGEGVGPRLAAFVVEKGRKRGYERFRIAVNNPFAYQALYRAGFAWTGERTGVAELVLERPGDRSPDRYREGLRVFRERSLGDAEESFLAERIDADPPPPLDG